MYAEFKGTFWSKSRFFLFHFSNVPSSLKGFVEIRKIPEVIGIWVAVLGANVKL